MNNREQLRLQREQAKEIYYYGLDLGKTNDYCALVVLKVQDYLRRKEIPLNKREMLVGHIDRWRPRKYTDVPKRVLKYVKRTASVAKQQYLLIERNSMGEALFDMFTDAETPDLEIYGVFSTPGREIGGENYRLNVPKRDLVTAAGLAMEQNRLTFAKGVKFQKATKEELANFVLKWTKTGHDSYEAMKSGEHDDIVMGLSIAAWAAGSERVEAVSGGWARIDLTNAPRIRPAGEIGSERIVWG